MTAIPILIIALLVAGTALAGRVFRKRSQHLQWVRDQAAPSLAELRSWRSLVNDGIARAVTHSYWVTRDMRYEWESRRPLPSTHASSLAARGREADEVRDLLAFCARDLRALADITNRQIRDAELRNQRAFFDVIETQPLTDEQATAVITFDNRVQLVAAAGSGKTSVMVARAAYAIRRQFVPADRILLLAFNKAAAAELTERVHNRLSAAGIDSTGVRASTFHSFGLDVIGRATGRRPRLASWVEGGQDVAMVSRIVDDLRERSFDFRFKWDMYRLLFARMADEPEGGDADAYDPSTRVTGFRTFHGETVKSQGERMIADFLFLNGVAYEYERAYAHDVADAEHSQYRPDFYYPDVDVWHEHWALDRHGEPPAEFEGYSSAMEWKRRQHRRFGTTLIESTWADIIDHSGFQPLAAELKTHGLTLDWNPERPLPGSDPIKHEDLARLVRSFMAHVKSNSLSRHDLERRLETSSRDMQRYRSRIFLDLYWAIHDEWNRRLREADSIDFEDMLVRAAEHLEADDVDMGFVHVLVDEFQDASRARARLARALVCKPHRFLLVVGDDWQSINRFAGADLAVMTSFSEWFGEGPTLRLQTTFRSPQSICDTASAFVMKNPRQFRKQVASVHAEHGPPAVLIGVRNRHEITSAISGVLDTLANRVRGGELVPGGSGQISVDVLGRYRFDRDLVPTSTPRELCVQFRTVHASKGLEADFVIVPNMGSGTYGFPSEIVDDPVLALAMTEADPYSHAEERRLFYVALTRARRQVTLISVRGSESPFVTELLKDGRLELSSLSTVDMSEPCPSCDTGVLVKRTRRSDGQQFLGCTSFPACRFTKNAEPKFASGY